jgi:hypothetical protein
MQTDHDQRPFASGSGARPSGLRERIEAAAALHDEADDAPVDDRHGADDDPEPSAS